jgi:hypothetical protein
MFSTTFIFKARWGSIQILGDFRVQTGGTLKRSRARAQRRTLRALRLHRAALGVCVAAPPVATRPLRPSAFPRTPRAPKRLEVPARHTPGRRSC